MRKIPNVFEYGEGRNRGVVDKVRPECQWVLNGEGIATEQLDGTNVRLTVRCGTVVRVEKRRNPSKIQKKKGIIDPWYVDACENSPEDKHIFAAVAGTDPGAMYEGEHCCEAIGPNIQGNPLWLDEPVCVPFNIEMYIHDAPDRSFDGLRALMENLDSLYTPGNRAEGIVFHHPDGRRAKIRRKDFGLK